MLDTTHLLNGLHTVRVRVLANSGAVTWFDPITIEVLNSSDILDPFGRIEFPRKQAELRGRCDIADPARRYSVVKGYALDSGIEEGDTGVGYVELLIDGAIFANSNTSCVFSPPRGGLTNCYGLRRLDIERVFPSLPNSPHAGFRFVLDVGALIGLGYPPGNHVLTVRAGDVAGNTENIHEINVTFTCDEYYDNEEAIGTIDHPRGLPGIYGGQLPVYGWVVDWEGIDFVEIQVDGAVVGTAMYGFYRSGPASLYPSYPNALGAGFNFVIDTLVLADGEHYVSVFTTDLLGNRTYIGRRKFIVDNIPN
jgi:hypothetical protein